MNKGRTVIKKIIFKLLGEKGYARAYAKGKIKDIKNGVLDEKEASFLPYFIKSEDTVLDIGANYGHYAIDMSKLCTDGEIFAFEPVPFTYQILKEVKDHFKVNQLHLHNAAVSNVKGTVEMTIPLLDFGAPNTGVAYIGKSGAQQSKKVAVTTLKVDDLEFNQPVTFIKIDIEGHEPEAFKGMEKLLLRDRPVILIEFSHNCLQRAGTTPKTFADYIMNDLKMDFYAVDESQLKPISTASPADGYYFLIPQDKKTDYSAIISS